MGTIYVCLRMRSVVGRKLGGLRPDGRFVIRILGGRGGWLFRGVLRVRVVKYVLYIETAS